jgi:hypothetical protein
LQGTDQIFTQKSFLAGPGVISSSAVKQPERTKRALPAASFLLLAVNMRKVWSAHSKMEYENNVSELPNVRGLCIIITNQQIRSEKYA